MIPLASRPRTYPLLRREFFIGKPRMAQGVMPGGGMDPATNLAVNGAILEAVVGVPAQFQQAGGAAPASRSFSAMIDSGASITVINIPLAQQLGLPQVSSTQLGGVGGVTESPIYAASFTIPQFEVTVDPIQIAGVANPLPGVDMLVGRDVLRSLHFSYHGGQGAFSLEAEEQPPTTQNQVLVQPSTPGTAPQPGFQPQGGLPQPPAAGTILGMKPLVAAGAGLGLVAVIGGALYLFDVI